MILQDLLAVLEETKTEYEIHENELGHIVLETKLRFTKDQQQLIEITDGAANYHYCNGSYTGYRYH